MGIEYEACPYCGGKKIEKIDRITRVVIKCGNTDECGQQIDSYPKEEQQ